MVDVILAAGGTGGHIYPAKALANLLERKAYQVSIAGVGLESVHFLGKEGGHVHSIKGKSPGKIRSNSRIFAPFAIPLSLLSLVPGFFEARCFIKKEKPKLVVGFGAFPSLPLILAAKSLRIPLYLFESNIIPGKVNRIFSRFSKGCFVPFSINGLYKKCVQLPIRLPMYFESATNEMSREDAHRRFGLDPDKKTVLVFGGSLGSEKINTVIPEALPPEYQVIHLAGREEQVEKVREVYLKRKIKAFVQAYYTPLQHGWIAADFAICRAGAQSIAESHFYSVPTILIPMPNSADNHQFFNAKWAAEEVGSSVVLEEKSLTKNTLQETINNLDLGKIKLKIDRFNKDDTRLQMETYIIDNHLG